MAAEAEIDVELLQREIKETYASVSEEPGRDFIFPTGRAGAEELGLVGGDGRVTGVDMTAEMLDKARRAAAEMGAGNVEYVASEAERLPFPDESFDVVISNGVIDLIPDKDAVFAELFRVLAPGRTDAARGRDDPEPGQRGGATQHRPVDRLNCRGAAGSSVRHAPRTARIRADRDRTARRYLRRSKFEDTRRKAHKFGARGTTLKARKPSG
jgi:ubiquinone/menaquinone biosynthesis C-methylase UbiE